MRLMGECRGSIDAVKRAEGELTEEDEDTTGLTNPSSTDTQSAGQSHTQTHHLKCCRQVVLRCEILHEPCEIHQHRLLPGVIERWELIQAQSLSEKHRHKQNLQQWQQLISDLQTMRAWLGQCEAELRQLRGLDLSTDIDTIQQRIKKLKVRMYVCLWGVFNVEFNLWSRNSVYHPVELCKLESFTGAKHWTCKRSHDS